MAADQRQTIVTLDLEGVLVPEIWIAVAERTGVEALKRTTRDEPDYDVLMRGRLAILDVQGLPIVRDWHVVRLAAKRLSPVEMVREKLKLIETLEPKLDAFITLTGDLALDQARRGPSP